MFRQNMEGKQEKNKSLAYLKKAITWIICIAIFVYLFKSNDISPRQLLDNLLMAHTSLFILYAVVYFILVLFIDVFAIRYFTERFSTSITFKETLIVRGVTYIMMIVNYAAAQGFFAIYLKKTHKAPIGKTLGTMAFITVIDLLLVFISALAAITITHDPIFSSHYKLMAGLSIPALILSYLLWGWFWKKTNHKWIKKLRKYKMVDWILSHDIFLIYREARLKDYVKLLIYRFPLLIIIIGAYNFALFSFHSGIPWRDIFLYNPIIIFLSAIPITPAGLGTGQALTIEFFRNKVFLDPAMMSQYNLTPETVLLTSSLSWFFANQILKGIFGFYFLQKSRKLHINIKELK